MAASAPNAGGGGGGDNWDFAALLEDFTPCFNWPSDSLPPSVEIDDSLGNPDCLKEAGGSRKRMRSGACGGSDSKAYKEKQRRDRLNERFQELSCILEPGRAPKTDKAAILSDAVRMVIQLREEAEKLKQENINLQGKVTELKAEKNEVREEKSKLKAEKEKLEQQVKALSTPFLPHPPQMHAPFVAPPQMVGSKMMPYAGYPGISMWQFMPPTAVVDTSPEDQTRNAPVA